MPHRNAPAEAPDSTIVSPDRSLVPPHPPLPSHYALPQQRGAFVNALFDRTAAEYDAINTVFSLGSGRWYRRNALRRAGLRAGMRVLDVATGTGLVAREAQRLAGPDGSVTGLDLSANMLAAARRSLDVPCVRARAEALPVAAGSLDFISMGYALRHVPDLARAFAEFFRVLRPSGTVLLLEIGAPSGRLATALAGFHVRRLVPALCRLRRHGGAAGLLGYYWDTIVACVPPSVILGALRRAGFAEVRCETSLGVFRAYTGRKPGPD